MKRLRYKTEYIILRVRNSSSHKPLRTFTQWFQPNSLARFLHLITFVIIILFILLIEVVSYILCLCVSVCVCVYYYFTPNAHTAFGGTQKDS